MTYGVWAILIALAMGTTAHAQGAPARFKDIATQEALDPDAAFSGMVLLAGEGHAPAMDRVGYYHRRGVGTPIDLETARQWYEKAVMAGHPWSTASLARVEIALGQGDTALHLLQVGVSEGKPGTRRLLATAHIDRRFGAASDPELGRGMLERMAVAGDKTAARDLVVRHNWNRLQGAASDAAVARVVEAGLAGDPRFAEAALIFLTRLNDKSPEVTGTRAALAKVLGIRDRVLSVERIRLAVDTAPHQFWTGVEAILDDTGPDDYARAASAAFWINKNAWVRVLQQELRALGYYTGRAHGRMTTRTIRAQNRFCRDAGIWKTCGTGPLRGPMVRAVAHAVAVRTKAMS